MRFNQKPVYGGVYGVLRGCGIAQGKHNNWLHIYKRSVPIKGSHSDQEATAGPVIYMASLFYSTLYKYETYSLLSRLYN